MKKLLSAILLLLVLSCALTSCTRIHKDPLDAAKQLDEKDYFVSLTVDEGSIKSFGKTLGIKISGVSSYLYAFPEDGNQEKGGYLFYCDKTENAKDLERELEDLLDEKEFYFKRGTIKRSGKIVFIGCEDVWEDVQNKITISF